MGQYDELLEWGEASRGNTSRSSARGPAGAAGERAWSGDSRVLG